MIICLFWEKATFWRKSQNIVITFGLTVTDPTAPIRIMMNLRMFKYCSRISSRKHSIGKSL
ncbi:hypothetical protein Hanom_Chr01g00063481 [Helianthus anomalus]